MLVGQQIGPFLVEEELGSGAMGGVYRASYTKTGLPVAIKVLLPGMLDSDLRGYDESLGANPYLPAPALLEPFAGYFLYAPQAGTLMVPPVAAPVRAQTSDYRYRYMGLYRTTGVPPFDPGVDPSDVSPLTYGHRYLSAPRWP